MLQTYRHTDRPSDEAGPGGAFAPNNFFFAASLIGFELIEMLLVHNTLPLSNL